MGLDAFPQAARLIRQDAARWLRPEQIADPREVTPMRLAVLLVRHVPFRATVWFRLAAAAKAAEIRGVPSYIQRRLLLKYGLELAPGTPVGGGLYIAHPVGCVLHAERIGENVSVVGGVTFGTRNDARWPTIGDRAYIGVGARILGGICIGADATVGANAVVLRDVPAGHVAVGVPATSRPATA